LFAYNSRTILFARNISCFYTKVQVRPLLRQRHFTAIGLLCKSAFGPRRHLNLRPLFYKLQTFATIIHLESPGATYTRITRKHAW